MLKYQQVAVEDLLHGGITTTEDTEVVLTDAQIAQKEVRNADSEEEATVIAR